MKAEPEQWKQYDSKYWVSDQGRVKRIYKNGKVHYLTPKKRSSTSKDNGLRVHIDNKYVNLKRLVWETFRGTIPDGYVVKHINGCQTMNDLYNLKLITWDECHKAADGAKAISKRVIDLNTGTVYPSGRIAEKYLHLSHSQISNYCRGKGKKGYFNLAFFDPDKRYGMKLKFIRRDESI